MTNTSWEMLSDQAVTAAAVVYFLALLSHVVEWSALRKLPVAIGPVRTPAGVGAGADRAALQDEERARVETTTTDPDTAHRTAMFGRLGVLLTMLAAGIHFVSMLGRGMAADPNRVPWGNMYEFSLSGTFVVVATYLVLFRRFRLGWLAPLVLMFTLGILTVAMIVLHEQVSPLPEALSGPWLVIHVVAAIISTGAFTIGGMASLLYLVKERWGCSGNAYVARLPEVRDLDRISYRLHAFGFPVWTFAVLITGPVWAHQAWGSYWNWDPKEVFAFITWVVYAAYLHARSTAGWKGRNAAIVALIGLATLWFNFIGINYFSTTSQHSYAMEAPVSPDVG